MNTRLITLSIFLFLPIFLCAQIYNWEGGFFIGAANYEGDVVVPTVFKVNESNPAYGLFLRRQLHEEWAVRINGFTGKISGDDLNFSDDFWRPQRAFSFTSTVNELSLMAEWEPIGSKRYKTKGKYNSIISPYFFTGVGATMFSPEASFENNTLDFLAGKIRADKNTDYPTTKISVPIGGGVKIDLGDKYILGFEVGMRTAFTDYLDGISLSADPGDNDWYAFGGATMSFRFGSEDSDKDGIVDFMDQCPEVPGLEHFGGCPDTDEDGIADGEDTCPLIFGEAKFKGCPDTDKDGIADHRDACPQEAGLRERRGCPIRDADQDGIEDDKDACPQVAGIPSKKGCPFIDADKDGVEDKFDNCPTVFGTKALSGCPDEDEDGITDSEDRCPFDPGQISNLGCPEIVRLLGEYDSPTDFIPQTIYYGNNSHRSSQQYQLMLNELSSYMKQNPEFNLRINGFTDGNGNKYYNQKLSLRRAKKCFDYLVSSGVSSSRIKYRGYGEELPAATNVTEEGRKLNRRTEFQLYRAPDND